jgi:hypothetical protein
LRVAGRGSVWEQEVCEVLYEHIGSGGGEHVPTVHRHLVLDTGPDDVARGDSLEVDLVVRRHHAKGLLDAQVKGAAHAPGDMPAESTKATRHRAPSLCLAFLDLLAGLEGGNPQLLQLLLRGVVGRLHSLSLGRRVPQGDPQA